MLPLQQINFDLKNTGLMDSFPLFIIFKNLLYLSKQIILDKYNYYFEEIKEKIFKIFIFNFIY